MKMNEYMFYCEYYQAMQKHQAKASLFCTFGIHNTAGVLVLDRRHYGSPTANLYAHFDLDLLNILYTLQCMYPPQCSHVRMTAEEEFIKISTSLGDQLLLPKKAGIDI